jgi:transcription elongation factor Elf1
MGKRKHLPISIHQTLHGNLSVNWQTDYIGEFNCPHCHRGQLSHFFYDKKTLCKIQLGCELCHTSTPLSYQIRQSPPISIHQTLHGNLQVNWQTDYAGEFICPQCNQGKITNFYYSKGAVCKLKLSCDFCHQTTYLTGTVKHLPISTHLTLQGTLSVNWAEKYAGEFICPQCNQGQISKFNYTNGHSCQLKLGCNHCSQKTLLFCQVPPQIHSYRPHLVCPNPLCHQIGPNGQKGWIYESFQANSKSRNIYILYSNQVSILPVQHR